MSDRPGSLLLRGWRPAGGLEPAAGAPAGPHPDRFDLRLRAGVIEGIGGLPSLPGETVLELAGAYLTPGLIDAHVHLGSGRPRTPGPQATEGPGPSAGAARWRRNAAATLRAGVTAVRNLGNVLDRAAQELLEASGDEPSFPVVVTAGRALTRKGAYGGFLGQEVEGTASMRRAVQTEVARGAAVIKVMVSGGVAFATGTVAGPFWTPAELGQVVALAHEAGVPVAAHANGPAACRLALEAGVDCLEHGILCGDEVLPLLAQRGVAWVPTLAPLWATLQGADPPAALAGVFARHQEAVRRGLELGVRVVAGTDAGSPAVPHGSLGWELGLLRQVGFSPSGLARAATAGAAELLGLGGGYGRLEVGARTDLAWFAADPLAPESPTLLPPGGVIRAGRLLAP